MALGIVFFAPSLFSGDADTLTGADPTGSLSTGLGQAVEPIMKSPISRPQPSAEPVQAGSPVPYSTKPLQHGGYYTDGVRQDGNYYQEGVHVDGRHTPPDLTGEEFRSTTTPNSNDAVSMPAAR